jgi:isopentenyldiphosphate isomerase
MIQTNTQIKIGDKTYEVNYPNVRQKLEIENLKIFLSSGKYGELARSAHKTASKLLDLIDAVAYFSILIPEIKSNMTVNDFENMDIVTQRNMMRAYKINFYPWFEQIEAELNKEDDDDENSTTSEPEETIQ